MFEWMKEQRRHSLTVLQKRLDDMQSTIDRLRKQSVEYHFHIEKVDIHHPTLEQLTFQLEQLDVDQLSGALNIGNNFGVNVGDAADGAQAQRMKKSDNQQQGKSSVDRTKTGYKFSFPAKEES